MNRGAAPADPWREALHIPSGPFGWRVRLAVLATGLVVIGGCVEPLLVFPADPSTRFTGSEAAFVRQTRDVVDIIVDAPVLHAFTLRYEVTIVDPPEGFVPEPEEGPCIPEADGGPVAEVTARGWWGIPLGSVLWACWG